MLKCIFCLLYLLIICVTRTSKHSQFSIDGNYVVFSDSCSQPEGGGGGANSTAALELGKIIFSR